MEPADIQLVDDVLLSSARRVTIYSPLIICVSFRDFVTFRWKNDFSWKFVNWPKNVRTPKSDFVFRDFVTFRWKTDFSWKIVNSPKSVNNPKNNHTRLKRHPSLDEVIRIMHFMPIAINFITVSPKITSHTSHDRLPSGLGRPVSNWLRYGSTGSICVKRLINSE